MLAALSSETSGAGRLDMIATFVETGGLEARRSKTHVFVVNPRCEGNVHAVLAVNVGPAVMGHRSKVKLRGGAACGAHVTADVVASRLAALAVSGTRGRQGLGHAALVFHDWPSDPRPTIEAVGPTVADLDPRFTWIVDPTGGLTCTVSKGFGRLAVTSPSEQFLDAMAREIRRKFKPTHDLYPIDNNPRLAHRFLPGAFITSPGKPCAEGNKWRLDVEYQHVPGDETSVEALRAFTGQVCADAGDGSSVTGVYSFKPVKFPFENAAARALLQAHRHATGKEAYVDWHVLPGIARALHEKSCTDVAMLGPGNPFLVGTQKETVTAAEADVFESIASHVLEHVKGGEP